MLTEADVTFVLSNGGHNAGIVNPPGHPNRHHQIATHKETESYVDPDAWQASAVHHEGSWWPCWLDWLERLSGTKSAPPPMGGLPRLMRRSATRRASMSWNREGKNRPGGKLSLISL
jgi:polyhydroxyalkanoate synthase subunit PhaC